MEQQKLLIIIIYVNQFTYFIHTIGTYTQAVMVFLSSFSGTHRGVNYNKR